MTRATALTTSSITVLLALASSAAAQDDWPPPEEEEPRTSADAPVANQPAIDLAPPPARDPSALAGRPDAEERDVSQDRLLHGFRLGYLFIANADSAWDAKRPEEGTYAEHYDLVSAHQFIFGYELTWRMIGHEWLNVVLVGNVMVAGIEQSRFFPSLNWLLGFELDQTFQIGVGVDLTPTKDRAAHMIVAAGWTPRVGGFYVPVHFFFIPDVHAHHRLGVTTGVSW